MSEVITAVYENGVLRPLVPITLAEHQTVRLQIIPDQDTENIEHIFQALHKTGVLTPPQDFSEHEPISDEEQRKLAKILGKATKKPISEIVIEDRGE